jgi:hypothetical protein
MATTPSDTNPSTASVSRKKATFEPKGSPTRQLQNTRAIAAFYRREANDLRRKAAQWDRLATSLDRTIADRTPMALDQVCEALRSGIDGARQRACSMAGLDPFLSERAAFAAIFGPVSHALLPVPIGEKASSAVAPASAIDQAIAIVRSANGEAIDWSQEPVTERERAVRGAYLRRLIAEELGGLRLSTIALRLQADGQTPSSDLLAAIDESKRILRADVAADERDRLRRAGEESDDGR